MQFDRSISTLTYVSLYTKINEKIISLFCLNFGDGVRKGLHWFDFADMINTVSTLKQLGETRVYLVIQLIVHCKGSQGNNSRPETQKQKLKQRLWRNTVHSLFTHMACSVCFLYMPGVPTCPRVTLSTVG